jgi:threonine/homoserine/homoserine lactone efflux protein
MMNSNHDIQCQLLNRTMCLQTSNQGTARMEHLWLFALMVFGIIVLPGADMAFVVASAVTGGKKSGFAAVLGIIVGGFIHVGAAVFGIGLLLQNFPQAFNAMLVAGCLYVVWMGIALLRSTPGAIDIVTATAASQRQVFLRALATCLLNPKAYAFMFAVFPQFLRPQQGSILLQAAAMSAIIAFNQLIIYGSIALLSARFRVWLSGSQRMQLLFSRLIGMLLLLTAAWAIITGWRFK